MTGSRNRTQTTCIKSLGEKSKASKALEHTARRCGLEQSDLKSPFNCIFHRNDKVIVSVLQ